MFIGFRVRGRERGGRRQREREERKTGRDRNICGRGSIINWLPPIPVPTGNLTGNWGMCPGLTGNEAGKLLVYIQEDSPSPLPGPDSHFNIILRVTEKGVVWKRRNWSWFERGLKSSRQALVVVSIRVLAVGMEKMMGMEVYFENGTRRTCYWIGCVRLGSDSNQFTSKLLVWANG